MRVYVMVAALAVALLTLGWFWFGRDDRSGGVAFFNLATPSVCRAGELSIGVSGGRFTAFLPGRKLTQLGDRFLSADVSLRNAGAVPQAVDLLRFTASDAPEHAFAVMEADDGQPGLTTLLSPDAEVSGKIAIELPPSVRAVKLTYDDGCTRQEWLLP
jgi:hypothetical protein